MDETQKQSRAPIVRPIRQIPEQQEQKKQRISFMMAVMLISVAGFIDLFQALLNLLLVGEFISNIISVGADALFVVWFLMLGVNFSKDPKALMSMAVQGIVGLIPVLNTLPELTLGVVGVIIFTRIVDKSNLFAKIANTTQTKTRPPLNR